MEEQEQQVIEVVGYGDVRDIAQDAAEQAAAEVLQDAQESSAEDIHEVAKDAADAAADAVAQDSHEVLKTDGNAIAEKAAQGAVAGVQEALDAQLEKMDARSAEVATVTLDAEQYEYIQTQLQASFYLSLLVLVLLSAVFGMQLWRVAVRGR